MAKKAATNKKSPKAEPVAKKGAAKKAAEPAAKAEPAARRTAPKKGAAKKAAEPEPVVKAEPAARKGVAKKAAEPEPEPAVKAEPVAKAKKVGAKKAAGGKKAAKKAPASTEITEGDLAQVYAKAWTDEAFRTLLETDPTAALKQYAAENGLEWTKLVRLPAQPKGAEEQDENCIHLVSCC